MTAVITERQLSLFASKRQRGKLPPPASEFAVHCLIADTLRRWLVPGWRAFHVPNGEKREEQTAERLKRMLTTPGVSDFILFGPPEARVHALELKRRRQRPTKAQAAFLADVRQAGGKATYVDSYDAALAILKEWGALPSTLELVDGDCLYVRRTLEAPA